jgi:hypothetical protein
VNSPTTAPGRVRCLDDTVPEAPPREVPARPVVGLGAPSAAEPPCQPHRSDSFETIEATIFRDTRELELDHGACDGVQHATKANPCEHRRHEMSVRAMKQVPAAAKASV